MSMIIISAPETELRSVTYMYSQRNAQNFANMSDQLDKL